MNVCDMGVQVHICLTSDSVNVCHLCGHIWAVRIWEYVLGMFVYVRDQEELNNAAREVSRGQITKYCE